MTFYNPFVLYFLPILFLPLLLNLRKIYSHNSQTIPSLYFFNLLNKERNYNPLNKFWIEILLETLFLFIILLLWSRPIFTNNENIKNNLLLLLDDSSSLNYFYKYNQKQAVKNDLHTSLEENIFKEIEILPLSKLPQDETTILSSSKEINQYFSQIAQNGNWNIKDLLFFLNNFKKNNINNYNILLYSDLKSNHFKSSKKIPSFKRPFWIYQEKTTPYFEWKLPSRKHFFKNERIQFNITSFIPTYLKKETFKVTAYLDKKVIFSGKISNKKTYLVEFIAQEKGMKQLKVVLAKDEKVILKKTSLLFFHEPFSIYIESNDGKLLNFFKAIFQYDINNGNIILTKEANFFIVTDLAKSNIKSFNFNKKYLIMANPLGNINDLNKQLNQHNIKDFEFTKALKPNFKSLLKRHISNRSFNPLEIGIEKFLSVSFNKELSFFPITTIDNYFTSFQKIICFSLLF